MEQRYLIELPRRVVCKNIQHAAELMEFIGRYSAVESIDNRSPEEVAANRLGFSYYQVFRPCFAGVEARELRHGQFTGDVQFMNALRDVEQEQRDAEAANQALEAEAAE